MCAGEPRSGRSRLRDPTVQRVVLGVSRSGGRVGRFPLRPHRAASLPSVAREAGVGIATVFRHFPTKEALVAAVFSDRRDAYAYADAVATALDHPDPWHGLTGCIEAACAMQAADNGFADVLTMAFPTAQATAGRLRADFDPSDLVLLHMANLGVVNACGDAAPDAWRRVVALMIQSFEAPARAPLPASPAHDDLYRAMLRALPAGDTVARKPDPNS
ncbi:TetR family transcriptional regulator [Streptomyces sp. NPDC008092]|uniref:TetR/AcrR family transcriptional regulator n=1 Tax=Streptomyces sp. NPDC008092 TaxID=3364808 RepID=UPI0036EA5E60